MWAFLWIRTGEGRTYETLKYVFVFCGAVHSNSLWEGSESWQRVWGRGRRGGWRTDSSCTSFLCLPLKWPCFSPKHVAEGVSGLWPLSTSEGLPYTRTHKIEAVPVAQATSQISTQVSLHLWETPQHLECKQLFAAKRFLQEAALCRRLLLFCHVSKGIF